MKQKFNLTSLLMLSMVVTNAQADPHEKSIPGNKPGNPALVSTEAELKELMKLSEGDHPYKVEDFFEHPKFSDFQLSPNGQHLSFKERDDKGKGHIMIKEVSTGTIIRALEEKEDVIIGYGWATNTRLLYLMDNGGNENYHLYSVEIDGSNNIDLTPYDGVRATILKQSPEQRDFLIVSMNKDNPQTFEPYKVNIHTGDTVKLYEDKDPDNPIDGYDFDKDLNLRGFNRISNGTEYQYFYKFVGAKDFELVHTSKWYNKFKILSFNYASKNPDEAYVLTNQNSDKARILLYDLKSKKVLKKIFSNKNFDATHIVLSRKRNWEADYIDYQSKRYIIKPLSHHFKTIYKNLHKQFKGYQFEVSDPTDKEDQYLIKVSSDQLYGKFYQYNTITRKATLLHDLMPKLKEEDMGVMKPITFKSRDGLTIHGYITLPKTALKGKKVPMVVNPHGGPQGTRDTWGFNKEAQLFASRGYATLQINFRISDGYGMKFFRAGFKQTGQKIMDDLEAGVHYAIKQGWIDQNNIAIYGGSHGGYATLMGLIKTPELYKAGVDYVGISNIFTFFEAFPPYWKPLREMLKDVWYDLDDPVEANIAKEVSPIYHIDKIKAPLFVVQGGNDPRVNINESDQIVEALRKKGFDVPYMVKYNEGHGFIKEENQIDFYKAMVGFFSQHLK
ncbi:alpha/beta hydrolase family protein [Chryseobacterium paridis]|uniref:S9 family peptidase n=1 Tax=Chryseobacterium paridis TaxID=2800328 RepID=A0ABS1FX73_9FLAO|nr:S9 family peptidase [Chryseobacterium paridis]MBK1897015.1 S9 family peptidase [Chryseobacterium paridis]